MVEMALGAKSRDYVIDSLGAAAGLCSLLLEIAPHCGEAFAVVPEGTDRRRAERFDMSGAMSRRQSMNWLSNHVDRRFRSEPASTIVFQDVWAEPHDRITHAATSRRFVSDREVYYFLESRDYDPLALASLVNEPISYLLIGVLTRCGTLRDDEDTDRRVERIAQGVQEIFVSAYDQDGFVVWRRQS